MTYSMVVNPENAIETDLFFLNPVTGILSLRKVWDRGEKKEYRVCEQVFQHSFSLSFSFLVIVFFPC